MVDGVWETEEPKGVPQERNGLPLGPVREGLTWRTQILLAPGPELLCTTRPNCTASKKKALGAQNPQVIMGLDEFLTFLLSSCVSREMVELS